MQKTSEIDSIRFLGSLGRFQVIFEKVERLQLFHRKKIFGRKFFPPEISWFFDLFFEKQNFTRTYTLCVVRSEDEKIRFTLLVAYVNDVENCSRQKHCHFEILESFWIVNYTATPITLNSKNRPCSRVMQSGVGMSRKVETPSLCSILWDFNSVEFHRKWPRHFRGHALRKSKNHDFAPKKWNDFFGRFSKCMCAEVVRSFSVKLHWIEVPQDTAYWWSFSFPTHSYTTLHDLWTWSILRILRYGISWFFAIFKMHVLGSGVVIFGETPLNWTPTRYCRLMEFQLSYSFLLHHFAGPVNMLTFSNFALWEDFFDFQNACTRKWCGHFRWNSTELKSHKILHNDGVSTFLLIPTPLCMTREHGLFFDFCSMIFHDFGRFSPKSVVQDHVDSSRPNRVDCLGYRNVNGAR